MHAISAARRAEAERFGVPMQPIYGWPPTAGYYEAEYPAYAQLVLEGKGQVVCMVWLPIAVFQDPSPNEDDPRDGWLALINGYPADVHCVWPECSGRPISQAKYHAMIAEGGGTERKKATKEPK